MRNYPVNDNANKPLTPHTQLTVPVTMNGHLAEIGITPTREHYENGIQIINGDKEFNAHLSEYLNNTKTAQSGFNYHLISVFGSQSTGKSTLLNYLFGTQFGVMSESERRQTTKGIWMSRNKQENTKEQGLQRMADGILVMDVEGTDGRERGEDQDFERKSALFALATSEVLIINIWEHQVGLYQGANMGLLKTVFEVNLQLFLKDKKSNPRSLLFFVIRDHLGTTPLVNLRNTLKSDLSNIWTSLSKPPGLEQSRIEDYFDFAFAALPHKILQPENFLAAVKELGSRFRVGRRPPKDEFGGNSEDDNGVFLPEYHRRIPADGFSVYAEGVWEQIISNKDLDLPSQQELLAQFRCDEISREVLELFDAPIVPLEEKQAEGIKTGKQLVLKELGDVAKAARKRTLEAFEEKASRYHKGVFTRKRHELDSKIDTRLKNLYNGQLSAAHKHGISCFCDSVSTEMKAGQRKNVSYEFAEIVAEQKKIALEYFQLEIEKLFIKDLAWTDFAQEYNLYSQELDVASSSLRKEEMRRLAARIERWVRTSLGELVSLEFNKLGSTRRVNGDFEKPKVNQKEEFLWDRIWDLFVTTVTEAESRFLERAKTFEADQDEIKAGQWRLRRKSWIILRAKLDEEVMEGNIMTKLRDNFEDRFRYDDDGVPRIWRPTDDIEGIYTVAKESTLTLINLLSKFILHETQEFPTLPEWIGSRPPNDPNDEEDLTPIRGLDDEDGSKLKDEMTILSTVRRQDLVTRFKKQADGVYVEAKRSAIGSVAQVPLYFWLLVLFLGWNEFLAIIRNPIYFLILTIFGGGFYVIWSLNLSGPVISMLNAAVIQGINIGKVRLREFLEEHEDSRRNLTSISKEAGCISLDTLDGVGKRIEKNDERI